jgi:lantibiotic modifying enzyme
METSAFGIFGLLGLNCLLYVMLVITRQFSKQAAEQVVAKVIQHHHATTIGHDEEPA